MRRFFLLILILLAQGGLGGCSGYYALTVPDQLAPAGEDAVTVVRLQRNDFIFLPMPVQQAAMRMSVPGCQDRAAYTDEQGYGGTNVAIPSKPGRYEMTVAHLDKQGEEISTTVPLYVWDPGRKIVAVDLDGLPVCSQAETDQVRQALNKFSAGANILYLTVHKEKDYASLHKWIGEIGYPDGPVLSWRRRGWHIARGGRLGIRIVTEPRLVSQLDEIRKKFTGLEIGVCNSPLAGRAFTEAGLQAVIVGDGETWSDLAERGL